MGLHSQSQAQHTMFSLLASPKACQTITHNKLGMVWKKVQRDLLDAIYKYLLFICLMQQRKC